jgi:hypothetical protein
MMKSARRSLILVSAWVALFAFAPSETSARPCAPKRVVPVATETPDEEASNLQRAGGSTRTNLIPPGQTEKHGHAEVLIDAPIDVVEMQVRAFGQYKDLAPGKFKTSKIIDKTETSTDVYMQISIMKGFVTLWQVMRFGPTRAVSADTRVIEGAYVKGNLKTAHSLFALRKVSERRTILKADILISVDVAAPEELLDEELRDYAADALVGLRDKSQAYARSQSR